MSATEELRRLLDERGVEWEDCGNGATYVEHNGEAWRFDYDEPFDQLAIVCLSGYTPEQAIAATLGAGTCRPREVRSRFSKTQERVTYYCECGYELGGYMTAELPFPHTYNEDSLPNFCPNCGRKVVDW